MVGIGGCLSESWERVGPGLTRWGRLAAGWRSCGCIQAWDKGSLASGGNLAGGRIDLVGAEFGFAALLG